MTGLGPKKLVKSTGLVIFAGVKTSLSDSVKKAFDGSGGRAEEFTRVSLAAILG